MDQFFHGVSINGWFYFMENAMKMDDFGVPLFQETTRCLYNSYNYVFVEIGYNSWMDRI